MLAEQKMLSVFGSINLDVSVRCAQLPAAGETVLGSAALLSPGGKGANQAHAAQRFGVPTRLFGAVGVDGFAMPALASLRDAGVGLGGVAELAHEATGLAMITVGEDGDNSIVVAPGANALARAAQVSDAVLRASRVLLLQLEVPAEESFALARRARAAGCRVVLNASPLAPSLEIDAASLDLVIVNMLELEQLCLQRGVSRSDAAQRALALASHCRSTCW
ncbi:MAG TPA: PfkB family carbohydrate kinase [Albitalea sp.]|nr:PfkB family carbohydrate kinase [Albitalea sp.]